MEATLASVREEERAKAAEAVAAKERELLEAQALKEKELQNEKEKMEAEYHSPYCFAVSLIVPISILVAFYAFFFHLHSPWHSFLIPFQIRLPPPMHDSDLALLLGSMRRSTPWSANRSSSPPPSTILVSRSTEVRHWSSTNCSLSEF